jgi:hypothetical protein
MRTILVCTLLVLPGLAARAEQARTCTIAQVREIVLAQQRGGPTPATQDDLTPTAESGTRYQVTIDCGKERFYGVFTSARGFDAAIFTVGLKVPTTFDREEVRLRRVDNREAIGHIGAQEADRK